MPSLSSVRTLSTCSRLVSGFFTEIVQHIHSLRASGVRFSHAASASASDARDSRKSSGASWTTPPEISLLVIDKWPSLARLAGTHGVSHGADWLSSPVSNCSTSVSTTRPLSHDGGRGFDRPSPTRRGEPECAPKPRPVGPHLVPPPLLGGGLGERVALLVLAQVDQPALRGDGHRLSAIARAQLAQQRADVKLGGAPGNAQLDGDFLILQATRQ